MANRNNDRKYLDALRNTDALRIIEKRYGKAPLHRRLWCRIEILWDRLLWKVFGYDRYGNGKE